MRESVGDLYLIHRALGAGLKEMSPRGKFPFSNQRTEYCENTSDKLGS